MSIAATKRSALTSARKPRPSAAERKVLETQRRHEQEARNVAAREAFEKERPQRWLEIFAKAMRLALIVPDHPEFVEQHSWWFQGFGVDAHKQSFRIETLGGSWVAQGTLHASDVDRLSVALDDSLAWFDEYLAEKERQRLAALEEQRKREEALAKLTDDDRRVLGLPRRR